MRGPNANWIAGVAVVVLMTAWAPPPAFAQQQAAAQSGDATVAARKPLDADQMEVLVARIALYPDELIAVISGASLYPLQIVEAARYLDAYDKDKSLKPKDSWDGSVISLLNYPEIVRMMSSDLDWTQALADALAWQQKDVLVAIQQLREEAVAKGIIKTDDKVKVETQNDNIVIQPANPQVVYIPRYEPEMLYVPDYESVPIAYYADPYPNYWAPTATFFAGAVTGAVWAAAIDWNDWGVWGGNWHGGDVDIDCNNCFNNINGKVNFGDVDWKNVDRSKIQIDRDQFAKFNSTNITNNIKANGNNAIGNRANDLKRRETVGANRPGNQTLGGSQDIRKSTLDGLKAAPNAPALSDANRSVLKQAGANRPAASTQNLAKPQLKQGGGAKPANLDRPAGKPKVGGKVDNRPKAPSGLGNMERGKAAQISSNRGQKAMGGGQRGGGGHKAVKRPAGRSR